jgi:hypothetical protein
VYCNFQTKNTQNKGRTERRLKERTGYVFVAVALATADFTALAVADTTLADDVLNNAQSNPPLGIVFNGVLRWSAVSPNTAFPHQFRSRLLGNCNVKNITITPITAPLSNALLST